MSAGLVIVGGGLAAQRCCEVLRAAGDDRPVTILAAERVRPYDRPPLSKQALASGGLDVAFRPQQWYADHAIELRLGCPARALDPWPREVVVGHGERVPFDDLLIATGARAQMLPALARFGNVQALRTAGDADRLRAAFAQGGPLAIVGAGLIGLEAAATAVALGVEVTVVEAAPRPLSGILGPDATAWLTARHRAAGVTVRTGVTVEHARGGADARDLLLADGTRIACAHVLVGVGVRPAVEWLAGSGLGPDAVATDAQGRTELPHVYAAGDAATGGAHWEAASRSGAAVADALLGRPARKVAPPSFWTDQHGVRLTCLGHPRHAREMLVHGDLAADEFELDHVRGHRITAVLLAGRPPSALRAARARLSTPPPMERTAA